MLKVKGIFLLLILSLLFVIFHACGSGSSSGNYNGGGNNNGEVTLSVHWAKSFSLGGGINGDSATSVKPTSDGGYIIAGNGDYDIWVLKLDLKGDIAWQRKYGGSSWDSADAIQQTPDGGYIVAGNTISFSSNRDFWLLKLDPNGDIIWQKTYGESGTESAHFIQQTNDGGYIVTGDREIVPGRGGLDYDFWVLKLDPVGNIIWQKTYGGAGWESANVIQQTSNGGYIVAGDSQAFSAGNRDYWVLKLSPDGDIIWQRKYGGIGDEIAYSLQQTNDDGYIIAGLANVSIFGDGGDDDLWILKLDPDGNIIWQRKYGDADYEGARSILQTGESGYIVAGRKRFFINSGYSNNNYCTYCCGCGGNDAIYDQDLWILKLATNGDILWEKTYSGGGAEEANDIQQTSDGGYIVAGTSYLYYWLGDYSDFFVLRLKSDGTISSSAPSDIGANSYTTVQDTFAVSEVTTVIPIDTTAIVTDTTITGVNTNATLETWASD